MVTRTKSAHRCQICRLLPNLCICSDLPNLDLNPKLTIVMNNKERFRTTNSGILALACIRDSKLVLKGSGDPIAEENETAYLLYPGENAVEAQDLDMDGPLRLVVPDGTWPETRRICRRDYQLMSLPRLKLPSGPPSVYQLRANPNQSRLATMEAIARAYSVLVGPEVSKVLEDIFRIMVDRQLWIRGWLDTDKVFGGIPEGVVRHDPFLQLES